MSLMYCEKCKGIISISYKEGYKPSPEQQKICPSCLNPDHEQPKEEYKPFAEKLKILHHLSDVDSTTIQNNTSVNRVEFLKVRNARLKLTDTQEKELVDYLIKNSSLEIFNFINAIYQKIKDIGSITVLHTLGANLLGKEDSKIFEISFRVAKELSLPEENIIDNFFYYVMDKYITGNQKTYHFSLFKKKTNDSYAYKKETLYTISLSRTLFFDGPILDEIKKLTEIIESTARS